MRGTECLKSPTSMVIVFAITLALAMATYHLMEAPLHKRRPKQTSNIFGILLPLLAITALISWSLGFYYIGAVYVDATCSDGATTSSTAATANSSSHEVCSGGGGWHGNPLTWHPDKSSSCPMNFSWSSYARHCGEDASDVTHSRFLFLGDSTMNLLYSRLHPIFDSAWHDTAVSKNDCDRMEFLGLDPAPEWVPPPQGFAPLFKGLTHPYCQDTPSLRCYRGQVSVASGNVSKQCVLDFEYVPVEYAIDVSLQTNETNTTQGTIAAYVKKRYGSVDAIITNQGLHDFYMEAMSADDYVESVREQLLAFQGSVTVIIWILINHIFEDPVQTPFITNARCAQWNEAVTDMISSEFPNVYILDAYKMSKLQSMHKDRFHMTLDYYDVLADIVLSFAIPNADQ
ncbi:unnamed protein product [Prorocentrum cordatum]|uniref:SGNH domain-containing protein n=1 Tax=Prorocentrum cordatum TaxID=2364126 RepID=A0ABN9XPL2_9DINO|nr:unnamed protein product [Polarella glacialis]